MDGAQYHICVLATVISHYIPMKNNRSQTVPIRVVQNAIMVIIVQGWTLDCTVLQEKTVYKTDDILRLKKCLQLIDVTKLPY